MDYKLESSFIEFTIRQLIYFSSLKNSLCSVKIVDEDIEEE